MSTPPFTLHVRNLRGLRRIAWSPQGVSLLAGANGAGKTTLLLTLKLLHAALDMGLPRAVTHVLGGSYDLRNHHAALLDSFGEPIEIGCDLDNLSWRVSLIPRGATVDYLCEESFRAGDRIVFSKDSLGNFLYGNTRHESDERLGLRALIDASHGDPHLERMAGFIKKIAVFHDPDLMWLRLNGSRTTQDRQLHSRGVNAFTMLRRWFQEKGNRHRYQFVLEGLRAAFPRLIDDIDFQEAGQTIVLQTYRPDRREPLAIESEANGVLQLLVLLCDVAQAEPGSLIAIDEPENSLHPYALRCFLRRAQAWAERYSLMVLLATHSTVLLDQFSHLASQVYVLRPNANPGPVPLNELKDPRWLAAFQFGELYADGELGSNDDEPG